MGCSDIQTGQSGISANACAQGTNLPRQPCYWCDGEDLGYLQNSPGSLSLMYIGTRACYQTLYKGICEPIPGSTTGASTCVNYGPPAGYCTGTWEWYDRQS